mmetsp:Transcript_1859/g.5427  ORF Transcript_1859/g.5427 Transcript_1859/m.5427 type:complete len:218 (+) Transcript_1859:982-1635(+)
MRSLDLYLATRQISLFVMPDGIMRCPGYVLQMGMSACEIILRFGSRVNPNLSYSATIENLLNFCSCSERWRFACFSAVKCVNANAADASFSMDAAAAPDAESAASTPGQNAAADSAFKNTDSASASSPATPKRFTCPFFVSTWSCRPWPLVLWPKSSVLEPLPLRASPPRVWTRKIMDSGISQSPFGRRLSVRTPLPSSPPLPTALRPPPSAALASP